MSNPLLQPDGRFRRPNVVDESGQNRFADTADVVAADVVAADVVAADVVAAQSVGLPAGGDLFAPPSDDAGQVYKPHYQAVLPHRGTLLAVLGGIGAGMSWLLLLAFTSYALVGVMASFFGVALSLAVATIGYQDLKGLSLHAIDPEGRNATLLGFRLALAGIFVGGGAALAVIWLIVRGVVDIGL